MKHAFFLATAMAFGAFCAHAQEAATSKIVFETMEHDFGKIDKGSKVDTVFHFTNTGSGTLEIKDVSTSCGCTSAKPEKTSYAPGEKGSIPVTFNSGRFSGPIQKNVTIVTNDPDSPRTVVKIKAEVIVDIMIKPPSIFVNNLKRGSSHEQELLVSTERLEKLEVTELKSDQPYMATTMEQIDDKTVKIKVTVDGTKIPASESRLRGFVSFNTNSSSQPVIKTNVNVLVQNPVSAQPSSVYMFGSKEGQPREALVQLLASDDKPLKLSDISVDITHANPETPNDKKPADILSTELTEENGTSKIKIILSEKAQKGRFEGAIVIKTNIEEQPEVRIPVRGSVI